MSEQPSGLLAKAKHEFRFLRGRGALEITGIFLVFQIALIAFSNPNFPYLDNWSSVITQGVPVLALISIGAGVLMVAGEFDLSLGASIGFCAIAFIRISESYGWVLGFIAGIGSGVVIALINALIVVYTKIPSFIATLGMGYFWAGASIFVNGTTPALLSDETSAKIIPIFTAEHKILGFVFHMQMFWMVFFGIISWFFLHRHKLGNHVYAVGGNASAAEAISINPRKIKLMSFAYMGALVGFASVLIATRTSTMQPNSTADYTLMAVAAAVVGGTSLTGGRGSVIGMIVGAALILNIQDALILGKTDGFYIQLFLGLIIVIASIFNQVFERRAV